MPRPPIDPNTVFLNIPYDEEFLPLYIAYIVGLHQLGLVPHIASEIPGGERRLDRILALIKSCAYSIHDLSRVELSVAPTATPRFNMPLELGMTITWAHLHPRDHKWFVWESEAYRLQRSASDLNGTDPYIHAGTVEGVLSELRNAFWRKDAPSAERMRTSYSIVEHNMEDIFSKAGTRNPYANSVFKELCRRSSVLATWDRAKKQREQSE
jgi:hypothetical protein